MPHVTDDMRQCIDECLSCHSICIETVSHCLVKGGKHAEARRIHLLEDCADICSTSARFMLRGSDLHAEACAVCATVCERCAQDCESFDDDFMRRCAEACRNCAESCREMARPGRKAA